MFPLRISDVPWFKVRVPYSSHSELSACHHSNENRETIDVFHKNYTTVLPNHEGFPDCKSWYTVLFKAHLTLIFCLFRIYNYFRIASDELKREKLKQQMILLTLLICWAFLCVDVFCLNATRTDLCLVRVLFSRAQPFGPPLSKIHTKKHRH